MRIAVFTPNIRQERGGAFVFEQEIFHQAAGMERPGVQIVGIGWDRPLGLPKKMEWISLERSLNERLFSRLAHAFRSLSAKGRRINADWMNRFIADRLAAAKIDFVWYPSHTVPFTNWPYIFTVWDLQHRNAPFYPEVSLNGEWEHRESHFRKTIQKASFIITGNEAGREEIERYYGVQHDRIWLIPHPTPTMPEPARPGTVPKRPFLFYPAQFWSHKNHKTLIDVLLILGNKYGKLFDLVLTGVDKGNRGFIEKYVNELGLTGQVVFAGFVSREALSWYYRNAFCLTYASLCGPENLPPLEAMSLGCPAVVADVPGAREQFGDAALRVNGLDPEAWCGSILQLFDPLVREKLVTMGQERARLFTAAEAVDRLIDNLEKIKPLRRTWGW